MYMINLWHAELVLSHVCTLWTSHCDDKQTLWYGLGYHISTRTRPTVL